LPRTNKNTDLVVSEVKQLIQFSDIEWSESGNKQKSGISYSKDEIILSESYPYVVQLWKNYSNGRSLVLNQLSIPNPLNPANFSRSENEKNYISIYQYF
jgi:xanthine dehydrogenase iron-sulfur cluster and FAD-binding subunit A